MDDTKTKYRKGKSKDRDYNKEVPIAFENCCKKLDNFAVPYVTRN